MPCKVEASDKTGVQDGKGEDHGNDEKQGNDNEEENQPEASAAESINEVIETREEEETWEPNNAGIKGMAPDEDKRCHTETPAQQNNQNSNSDSDPDIYPDQFSTPLGIDEEKYDSPPSIQ